MTIKLIAVDMDGTFLNRQMDYDRIRFAKQYVKLKEQGIHFVVASGNQYYQLKSFFGDFQDELTYISENGALIIDRGIELFSVEIPKNNVRTITEEISKHPQLSVVVCGKKSAYMLDSVSEELFYEMKLYYHRLNRVPTFEVVEDQVLKFALSCPPHETDQLRSLLMSKINDLVTPISSGHGSIDLIVPGFHKASGIQLLQEKWKINDEQIMAFGDGGNDIEMLKHARFGFAMENGSAEVKEAAKYIAPSNNHNGVLEVIDHFFANKGPFKHLDN